MTTSISASQAPLAVAIHFDGDNLHLTLDDGRAVAVPISRYPRLLHATPVERDHWRLIGRGEGIHSPAYDEDLSVDGLLAGAQSRESVASLTRWLAARS